MLTNFPENTWLLFFRSLKLVLKVTPNAVTVEIDYNVHTYHPDYVRCMIYIPYGCQIIGRHSKNCNKCRFL